MEIIEAVDCHYVIEYDPATQLHTVKVEEIPVITFTGASAKEALEGAINAVNLLNAAIHAANQGEFCWHPVAGTSPEFVQYEEEPQRDAGFFVKVTVKQGKDRAVGGPSKAGDSEEQRLARAALYLVRKGWANRFDVYLTEEFSREWLEDEGGDVSPIWDSADQADVAHALKILEGEA